MNYPYFTMKKTGPAVAPDLFLSYTYEDASWI